MVALRQVMVVSAAAGAKPPARAAPSPKTAKPSPAKGNSLPAALQKPGVGGTVKRKPVAPVPKKQSPATRPKRTTPDLPWWLRDDVSAELKPLQATVASLLSPFTAFLREQQRARARILLENAVEGTERGLRAGEGGREAVERAVDEFAAVAASEAASGIKTTAPISATWRLTWTSERETLFLLRYGIPFVGSAGESYQIIDTAAGTLKNVIEFGDKGAAFVVDSKISGDEMPRRVDFRFTAATLRLAPPSKPVSLPPFGAGYFENLYVDDTLRIARDSRGDTLIVERTAPWRG